MRNLIFLFADFNFSFVFFAFFAFFWRNLLFQLTTLISVKIAKANNILSLNKYIEHCIDNKRKFHNLYTNNIITILAQSNRDNH